MSTWQAVAVIAGLLVFFYRLERWADRRRMSRAAKKAERRATERKFITEAQQARAEQQAAPAEGESVSACSPRGARLDGPPDEIIMLREKIADSQNLLRQASAEITRLNAERDGLAAWVEQQEAIIVMVRAQLTAAQVEAMRRHEAYRRQMEEPHLSEANEAPAEPDGQFRRLRALIVKELHPDHAPADSVDRALRAEVFKAIWPKIEALADTV